MSGIAAREGTQGVLHAAGAGTFDWDVAAGEVVVDDRLAALFGLPAPVAPLPVAALLDLVDPRDLAALRALLADPSGAAGYLARTFRVRTTDGTRRLLTAAGTVEVDGTGAPSRFTGVVLPAVPTPTYDDDPGRVLPADEQGRRVSRYTDALAEAVTVAEVCSAAQTMLMAAFDATGMLISLAESGRLRLVGHAGYTQEALDLLDGLRPGTAAPISETMRERIPLFVPSLQAYLHAWPEMTATAYATRKQAWAFLPLVVSRRTLGALTLSFDEPREFTTDERSILVSLAGQLAQALERARMREAEHDLAAELQRTMLPVSLPATEGLEVAVRYLPATDGIAVGGDWYDVVHLPDGQIALVVGDVQGHSVLAAAQMGQVRHALRAYAAEGHDPATVLSRTDRLMAEIAGEAFATCLLVHLDLRSEMATVASAGHPGPVLRRADGSVEVLEVEPGLPLGVQPGEPYDVQSVPLSPGDALLLFTDGLVEAGRRPLGEGLATLVETVRDLALADVEGAVATVLSTLTGDSPATERDDDVAVLLARFDGLALDRRPRAATHRVERGSPGPVSSARAFTTSALSRWDLGDIADRILLVVSELVTNAVKHGSGAVTLTLTLTAQRLLVEVHDESPELPEPRPVDIVSTSGRGMHIVSRLTDTWGGRPVEGGKVVWAEFDVGRQRRLLAPAERRTTPRPPDTAPPGQSPV